MLFRLERTPFHRGPKVINPEPRTIDVLAVLPMAVREDGSIVNLLLCRTEEGLRRIGEQLIWEAMQGGQYREAKRGRVGS
jgi:hypothetical protein